MPAGLYLGSFVVGAITHGFDVRTNGYGGGASANAVIRSIPYSPTNAVVTQRGGQKPRTRRYRVILYAEADYQAFLDVVDQNGVLTTPRELAGNAHLDEVSRDDFENPASAAGELSALLSFTMN